MSFTIFAFMILFINKTAGDGEGGDEQGVQERAEEAPLVQQEHPEPGGSAAVRQQAAGPPRGALVHIVLVREVPRPAQPLPREEHQQAPARRLLRSHRPG